MDTIKIYENYGCLGAEKRSVYTAENPHATAAAWDEMTVAVPDGWDAWKNDTGEIIVTAPWGWSYSPNEILAGDKEPVFRVVDDHDKQHSVVLKIVDIRR